VDSAGDPLVNGGLVKLQEIFDVLGARAGGGGGVSLGETSITAYRGDRGKTAYDHSQTTTGNPHGTTPAEITGFDTAVRTSRLQQMAAAGADVAITQYFFNTDAYFRFVDDARALGIDSDPARGRALLEAALALDPGFVLADSLLRNRRAGKVIVLDANPDVVAEAHTFHTAFSSGSLSK